MAAEGAIELIGAPSSEWLGVTLKRGERTFGVLVILAGSPAGPHVIVTVGRTPVSAASEAGTIAP